MWDQLFRCHFVPLLAPNPGDATADNLVLPSAGTSHGHVSVCVCHKSEFYRNGWTNRARFVAWEPPSTYLILCKKEIRVSPKIRVLPSGTLFQTPDFKKFAWAYRSSKRVIDLARERRTRSESDKLGRRRSKKLTVPPSSDARPLVYYSNHQALSTAQFRRACQLVTADSCRQLRNGVALFNRN